MVCFTLIMNALKKFWNYFSVYEKCLWLFSVSAILATQFIFEESKWISTVSSMMGITSLMFIAKGNPIGQVLCIIFASFYATSSFFQGFYGETITYAGMSLPMAVIALVSWLKNPYKNNKAQVKINTIHAKEWVFLGFLTLAVTTAFYFILKAFNTTNLPVSTFSIATSFVAVYLTFRRSPFYAIGYALNDIVLIILWVTASVNDPSNISLVVCFSVFLLSDTYAFFNWQKMQKKQKQNE